MKAESIASWEPIITQQPSLAIQTYDNRLQHISISQHGRRETQGMIRETQGVSKETHGIINLFQPAPPDESKIRELNALAATHPFCRFHKAKKHDTL